MIALPTPPIGRVLAAALLLAFPAGLVACGSSRPGLTAGPVVLDEGADPAAVGAHPVYQAAFEALRAALRSDDLPVARATSMRLRARLERERAALPTLDEARRNEGGPLSYQVLSGEMPSRESVDAALRLVQGFDRVIEGRARLGALQMEVILARVPGSERVRVSIAATSSWPAPLVLRPGAGTVEVLRTSLEPQAGDERRDSAKLALPEAVELRVPANGTASHELCQLPIEVPFGAIATRMRVDAVFLAGTLDEGDATYPAQDIDVLSGRRTDLAGKIPATTLEPGPLLKLVERGRAPLAALLERTVRIPPARFPETLDRLGELMEVRPQEAIRPLVPTLRWLTQAESFSRDAAGWRQWLLGRLEDRRRAGEVTPR